MRARAVLLLSLSITACRTSRPIAPDAPVTIGVALPLSGRLKALGEGARDAAMLVGEEKKDGRIRVVVRDSRGDAEGAAKAVEELVSEDGAIAIVGPLFRAEANAAAEKAQDLGVPLIALTGDRTVTDAGAYAFYAGLSPEDEMDALVAHAMDTLKLTTFAVLHPNIEYGQRMAELFRQRVEDRGGTIHSVDFYEAEETTFTKLIRHLVHRDEPPSGPEFREALAKCKEARDSFRKARCEKEAREHVPPRIEFDALFIPDGHERIALLASAVAAEDVIVERDPRALEKIEKTLGRKVRPITLLGTSAWNSPELPKKAGRTVENAIFADVTHDDADGDVARAFIAGFRKHFGRRPERQDSLLYDATRFLRDLLSSGPLPATTDDLRAAMHRVENFTGVTGAISFGDGTAARRSYKILTIENQKIREVGD